ncbi:hypothetical protein [Streptomyces sp. NPDC006610]|uniref:hypothetical protein n=1 Tax=Streptomyces sp. NPDC006610 TaxID=3154584 RepID=UPI0033AD9A5D
MAKTWEPTKKGARDLNNWLSSGKTVYTLRKIARNVAPYEDPYLYSAHTFDWRSPITGHWMTGHLSAAGLLAQEGTVYEQPPAGVRNIADPAPQVAGPLPAGYVGHLDEAEIRGLEKRVRDSSDPKKRRWGR